MNIIPDITSEVFSKPEIEAVEREQDEYKLIGKYRRTKGLRLFAYDSLKNELYEIDVDNKKSAEVSFIGGKMEVKEQSTEQATVDSRHIHFEALNQNSAANRLTKYKRGNIKDLCNLKECNTNGIKFW